MKKKLVLFFIGVLTLAILFGVQTFWRAEHNTEDTAEFGGEPTRITRAETARMVSLLAYSREDIESLKRIITYEDTDSSKWYDKYINAYCSMGLTQGGEKDGNAFRPMGYFTYGECRDLLEQLSRLLSGAGESEQAVDNLALKGNVLLEELQGKKKGSEYMDPSEWMEIYKVIQMEGYDLKPQEAELYFIESFEQSEELLKWQVLTDQGIYNGDGLTFAPFLNSKRKVYLSGTEILYVGEEAEGETQLSNIFIMDKEETWLNVFVEGCSKKFEMAGSMDEEIHDQVGDLYLEDGKVTRISIKPDRIKGRILVANDEYIEIEGYGKKALAANFCIYRTYGEMSMDKTNSLVVGYENAEFVIVGDEICAAVITEEVEAETIRVLLKTTGFKEYYHKKVTLTSDEDFSVLYGEKEKTYKAGKKVEIAKNSKLFKEKRVFVKSKKKNGTITVASIDRNGIHPSYEGTLEITGDEDGILIINELSIENYLYGVVPSEMPLSYGVEALKVQAVCARSYAYQHLLANSLRKYGAHVDDSASYQVYNNIPTGKNAIKAVDETAGETLAYEGEGITAYYFSTSCGYTAGANEVWNSTGDIPYLTGSLQLVKENKKLEKKARDLSKEKAFKDFIADDKYKTYDSESPWYRWQVTISKKNLKKSMEENLLTRIKANPGLIQVKTEDGGFESREISEIGKINKIEIAERKECGIITEIIVEGSENTIKIQSEYNIRLLLAPLYDTIVRQDESKVDGLSMLPSAFFYMETAGKNKDSYRFTGGGYGHGVGMSQNGAKAMADMGFTYQEILGHYYKGAGVTKI